MISQWVLAFILNVNTIKTVPIVYPQPLNYCVGWQAHNKWLLSCVGMDGKVYDMWYDYREA